MGPRSLVQGTGKTIWMVPQGRRPIKWGQKTNGWLVQKPLNSRLRSQNSHCLSNWKHCDQPGSHGCVHGYSSPHPCKGFLSLSTLKRFEMPDRNLKDTFASLQRGLLFKEDLASHSFQKHIKHSSPSYFSPFLPSVLSPQRHLRTMVLFNGKCSTCVRQ